MQTWPFQNAGIVTVRQVNTESVYLEAHLIQLNASAILAMLEMVFNAQ